MLSKKTNVLFVNEIGGDYGGNFLDSFTNLAEKIEAEGGQCCFAFPVRAKQKEWFKETAKRFPTFSYANNKELRKIVRKCYSKYSINIIHTNFFTNRMGIAMCLASFGKHIKIFFHWHCQPYQCASTLSGKLRKVYLLALYNIRKDTQISVAPGVTKNLEQYFKRKNIVTIENAVGENRLSLRDKNATKIEKHPGIIRVMIMAGYSPEKKGLEIALKAAKKLEEEGEKIELYIPSTGKTVENFVSEKMGEQWMKYIKVVRPTEAIVREYFSNMDFFISPSYTEAFPYSVIEAAYGGCQIVASKISGQEDTKIPNIYWIDDPNRTQIDEMAAQLAKAIRRANKESKEQKEQKVIENQALILKEYNLDKWCQRIISLYETNA